MGLELREITKRYPGVIANDGVSLTLGAGEVLGILGENGAGKSTLMNVLAGLVGPDGGRILIDGAEARFSSCADAIGHGIGMVHQHFMLVATLSVAENIALGERGGRNGILALDAVAQKIREIGARIALPVDPDARVEDLDIGSRQRVEIIKALYRGARYLILDEPTAVLARAESAGLFATIRSLAASGVGIVLISHKLDDIFEVADRVMVMRQGRVVDTAPIAGRSADDLVRAMVGGDIAAPDRGGARAPGAVVLEATSLRVGRAAGGTALSDVSFALHEGEILALAGVEGNGQRELIEVLSGLREAEAGAVRHRGKALPRRPSVRNLRAAGLRHVPEDRHGHGILQGLPLSENYLMTHLFDPVLNRFGWLRRAVAGRRTAEAVERFAVAAPGPAAAIGALSGGNQQKLVLARELSPGARVLLAAHPTRGLDVRTVAFVHDTLLKQSAAGLGILLVSSDLGEIWRLADRVMVAAGGRIRGPAPIGETTTGEVGTWMAGR